MIKKTIFFFTFLSCIINICFAQPAVLTEVAQSKYFNIYSHNEANLLQLTRQLDIRSEYLLIKGVSSGQEQPQYMLGVIADAIFLEACDILHMYLYSFKINIKICQSQQELNKVYREFFERELNAPAFYLHKQNAIYIDIQHIRPESFAYEMAHAIIAHYFAVLPPAEVQETLARDVGRQIKRLAK